MTDASSDIPPGAETKRTQVSLPAGSPVVVQASLPARRSGEGAETKRIQRIDHDLPCVRCEYNLRTLTPESLCPECAFPVAETLREEGDPRRLRYLRRYAGLYLFAYALYLPPSLAYACSYVIYRLNMVDSIYAIIAWPATILNWTAALLGGYVIVQLSRRRLLTRGGTQYLTTRWLLRLGVIYLLFTHFGGYRLLGSLYGSGWYVLAVAISNLLHSGFMVLLLLYLRGLLAPCLLTITRRLRLWGGLIVIQCVTVSIVWILDFWNVMPFSTRGPAAVFPSLTDAIQLGMYALHWAATVAGIVALLAIRGHLATRLRSIRDKVQVVEPATHPQPTRTRAYDTRGGKAP